MFIPIAIGICIPFATLGLFAGAMKVWMHFAGDGC